MNIPTHYHPDQQQVQGDSTEFFFLVARRCANCGGTGKVKPFPILEPDGLEPAPEGEVVDVALLECTECKGSPVTGMVVTLSPMDVLFATLERGQPRS